MYGIEENQTRLDVHRSQRKGFPEVVFGETKSVQQILSALSALSRGGYPAIVSRVKDDDRDHIQAYFEHGMWVSNNLFWANPNPNTDSLTCRSSVGVVTAGTSDIQLAKEVSFFVEVAGHGAVELFDVGVAGIHRFLNNAGVLHECDVIVVAAGMDGALPAVVAGLLAQPVIGLPTSVGYGVAKNGIAALNTMLASCAPGIAVVNIDNSYGAAMMAHSICHRITKRLESHES